MKAKAGVFPTVRSNYQDWYSPPLLQEGISQTEFGLSLLYAMFYPFSPQYRSNIMTHEDIIILGGSV